MTRPTAIPGLPGWGAKSAAAVLARFGHLEAIPEDWREWGVNAANPERLARTLAHERERAFLFRTLATLRTDIELFEDVDQLRWQGPTPAFAPLAARLDNGGTSTTWPVKQSLPWTTVSAPGSREATTDRVGVKRR